MRAFVRRRLSRTAVTMAVLAMVFATAGVAVGAGIGIHVPTITTPISEDQVTNLDVLRLELKNYYGDPTGTGNFGADSNYSKEAQHIADLGWNWLHAKSNLKNPHKAIVLDVDDTTLTTWNYEIFSNWAYNPGTNATYVNGELFPATPGMVDLVTMAHNAGYAIFWITGRPDSQHAATLGNLGVNGVGVDANYPAPTAIDIGHGTGGVNFTDGLFTKPPRPSTDPLDLYPAYLNTPEFCGPSIAANASCPTILYKSGTRAYIESQGYEIVGDFGDQFSDLIGGYANKVFKMPNPNYYLP